MTTSKHKYQEFVKDHYVPIFYKPWYLDAVCDSPWDVVIHEENGKIEGIWIYMIKRKFGLTYILHPQLCPYMGPLFFGSVDQTLVYNAMKRKLPNHHLIIQDFHHSASVSDNLARLSNQKYTYIISKDEDISTLEGKLSNNQKRKIRKAERDFTYENVESIEEFQSFLDESFASRARKNPYGGIKMKNLDESAQKNNARKIIKGIDSQGRVMAMQYILMDERWTYNLANGIRTDYRHDAISYILWTEIENALSSNRSFDFEGSVIPGIEAFFKSFRGTKTNYQSIYKSKNSLVDLLVRFKNPQLLRK